MPTSSWESHDSAGEGVTQMCTSEASYLSSATEIHTRCLNPGKIEPLSIKQQCHFPLEGQRISTNGEELLPTGEEGTQTHEAHRIGSSIV